MTKEQWLTCADPMILLNAVRQQFRQRRSDRKFRLFACACVRHIWWQQPDEDLPRELDLCERCADGEVTTRALMTARTRFRRTEESSSSIWAANNATFAMLADRAWAAAADVIERCRDFARFRAPEMAPPLQETPGVEVYLNFVPAMEAATSALDKQMANLFRDVFGNPYQRVAIDFAWLAWNQGPLPKMAMGIYEQRLFDTLPILADALEEAGCSDTAMLSHCRQPGDHVRGCWVVDLLLGKS
jgi:hypothetical protein